MAHANKRVHRARRIDPLDGATVELAQAIAQSDEGATARRTPRLPPPSSRVLLLIVGVCPLSETAASFLVVAPDKSAALVHPGTSYDSWAWWEW